MLPFIFEDENYKAATKGWAKTLIALWIIIKYLARGSVDLIMWGIVGIAIFTVFCLFYSNAVISWHIYPQYEHFNYLLALLASCSCIAICIAFLTLLLLYFFGIAARFFGLGFQESSEQGDKSSADNRSTDPTWRGLISRLKYYVPGPLAPIGTSAFLAFVVGVFFWSWSKFSETNLADLQLHVLPDSFLVHSRRIYASLFPYFMAMADIVKPYLP